ncbi:MAG TPA: hypothetical protein VLK33_21170 [Terriglobales bacterium]|nr:hypothetical protein [Terriglobales bacterium]
MNDFEKVLETSLASLQEGQTMEVILAKHAEFSSELKPLLTVALKLRANQSITPSPQFKEETLTRLEGYMRAHPRRPVWRRPALIARYAAAMATIALAFTTTGFALAQNALPGSSLYSWKLVSERAWRSVHVDQVYVDLEITQRRFTELLAVQNNPTLQQQAVERYAASLDQLQADIASQPQKASHARDVVNAQKGTVGDALGSENQPEDFYFIILTLDDLIEQTPQAQPTQEKTETSLPVVATAIPLFPTLSSGPKGNVEGDGEKEENKGWLQNLVDSLLGQ